MTTLDWTIISAYFMGIVAFAIVQARRQRSLQDYYLAGRRVPWWQSGDGVGPEGWSQLINEHLLR
jgi:Na+/proline symporter